MGGKANKNGVWVEQLFLKLVIGLSHMIWQAYWLNSSYWPILNLHAIFVRLPRIGYINKFESQVLRRGHAWFVLNIQKIYLNNANFSAIVRWKNLIVFYFSNICQLSDNRTVRLFEFSNPGLTNKLDTVGVPLSRQKGHPL